MMPHFILSRKSLFRPSNCYDVGLVRFQDEDEDDGDFEEGEPAAPANPGRSSGRKKSITLPPKKRGHGDKGGKAGLSQEDIKKATLEALAAKPVVIGLDRIKKKLTRREEERAAVSNLSGCKLDRCRTLSGNATAYSLLKFLDVC